MAAASGARRLHVSQRHLEQGGCLKFLSRQVTDFHVGGKTALAWRGVRHNLPAREPLSLWGGDKTRLPEWFQKRFSLATARNLFSSSCQNNSVCSRCRKHLAGFLSLCPERALLEMLSEVGLRQGIEEPATSWRAQGRCDQRCVTTLLKNCQRVKVARLSVRWAEELGLPWQPLQKGDGNRQGNSRWSARLKDGTTLVLKP